MTADDDRIAYLAGEDAGDQLRRARARRARRPPVPSWPTRRVWARTARRPSEAAVVAAVAEAARRPPRRAPQPTGARGGGTLAAGRRRRGRSCSWRSCVGPGATRRPPTSRRPSLGPSWRPAPRGRPSSRRPTRAGGSSSTPRVAPARRRSLLPGLAEGRGRRARPDRHVQRAGRRGALGGCVAAASYPTLTVTEESASDGTPASGRPRARRHRRRALNREPVRSARRTGRQTERWTAT